jgi:beta-N-acetylglucosaminidase
MYVTRHYTYKTKFSSSFLVVFMFCTVFFLCSNLAPNSAFAATLKLPTNAKITSSNGFNVRSKPSASAKRVGVLQKGSTILIIAKNNYWYKIKFGSGYGYIMGVKSGVTITSSVKTPTEQRYSAKGKITSSNGFNVRSKPSASAERIGGIHKGSTVSIVAKNKEWYKIKFESGYGYIMAVKSGLTIIRLNTAPKEQKYIAKGKITSSNGFNVRSKPSANTTRIGVVHKGSTVSIIAKNGNWYKIRFGPSYGYIMAVKSGLKMVPNNTASSTAYYTRVDLRKPSKVSAQRINDFIKEKHPNSLLLNYGSVFLEAQKKYGVNALYLVAHAMVESSWGVSLLAKTKNNIYGQNALDNNLDAAYSFSSLRECIMYQAKVVRNNWLEPTGNHYNGPTLIGMNKAYATDKQWASTIGEVMEEFYPYKAADYK